MHFDLANDNDKYRLVCQVSLYNHSSRPQQRSDHERNLEIDRIQYVFHLIYARFRDY